MELQPVYNSIDYYKSKIMEKTITCEKGRVLNEESRRIKAEIAKLEEILSNIQAQLDSMSNIKVVTSKENDGFQKRRVKYIEDQITNALAVIYPEDDFTAKIEYDFKYGSSKAYLHLEDGKGNDRLPFMTEGKLCQYLISFISIVSTVMGLGASEIFIDEAFGVSSENNLPKIGKMIKSHSDDGIQFIIIAQNSDLYADIPRREIRFHKEPATDGFELSGKVVIDEIIDF